MSGVGLEPEGRAPCGDQSTSMLGPPNQMRVFPARPRLPLPSGVPVSWRDGRGVPLQQPRL